MQAFRVDLLAKDGTLPAADMVTLSNVEPQGGIRFTSDAELAAFPGELWGSFDDEGRLAGMLATLPEGESVAIVAWRVAPDRRREGWGSRLLNRVLSSHADVVIRLASEAPTALSLLLKAGFIRSDPRDTCLVLRYRRGDDLAGPELTLDGEGWVSGARHIPSPNVNERPAGCAEELLVIHNISLPPFRYGGQGVEQLFTNCLNPEEHPYYQGIHALRVSAHFFVRRDGSLLQFAPTGARAWHAGISEFHGRSGCNDFSVGVEMEGCDFEPFSDAQYRTLIALIRCLAKTLPLAAMTGHQDIAPGRKSDPGQWFDWERVRRAVPLPVQR